MNRQPFEACPQLDTCSVNACPLDPERHASHPDDPEQRCTAHRAVRERIAIAFGFASGWARTPREVKADAARARWLALPEEERARRSAGLLAAPPRKRVPGFDGQVQGDAIPESDAAGQDPSAPNPPSAEP
jgi:hypothetical protein